MEYTTSVFLCLTISPSTQASSWTFFFVLQSKVLWRYPALLCWCHCRCLVWLFEAGTAQALLNGQRMEKQEPKFKPQPPPSLLLWICSFLSTFPVMSQILQEIFNRCYKVQLAPSQLILHKKKPSRNMLLLQNLCWYPTDTEKIPTPQPGMQSYSQYRFHQHLQNPINPTAKSVVQHNSTPFHLAKPIWVLFVK